MGPALSFPQAVPSASWSTGRRPSLRSCRGCTPSQKGERPPVTDGGAWGTTGGLRSQHASSRGRPRWPWAAGVRGLRGQGGASGAGRGRDGAPAHRPPGAGQLGTRFSVHNQVEPRGAFWAGAGRLPGADAARAQRRRLSPQAYDQEPRATALRADRADTAPFHICCHLVPTCVA